MYMSSKDKVKTVAVLGAGNMGTSLAQVIAENGHKVVIWNYAADPEPLEQIKNGRENKKYLPGIHLSENITVEPDLQKAVAGKKIVFFALPSNVVGGIAAQAGNFFKKEVICVDASKGMDEKSLGLVTENIKAGIPKKINPQIVTVSGPAMAIDMVQGGFTAMNIASKPEHAQKAVKKILENKNLKLIAMADFKGVEIAGSFKNTYAIAMGLCDGF